MRWDRGIFNGSNDEVDLPGLVMTNIAMERSTMFNGKTHHKWPSSIAMLNYRRVDLYTC